MLPLIAIPTAILWIIAVILAFFANPGPFAGMSHHTYTGVLFLLAVVLSVVLFFVARGRESKRTNTLNCFALSLLVAPLSLGLVLKMLAAIVAFLLLRYVAVYAIAFWKAGVFRLKWVQWRAEVLMWVSDQAFNFSIWLAKKARAITGAYLAK